MLPSPGRMTARPSTGDMIILSDPDDKSLSDDGSAPAPNDASARARRSPASSLDPRPKEEDQELAPAQAIEAIELSSDDDDDGAASSVEDPYEIEIPDEETAQKIRLALQHKRMLTHKAGVQAYRVVPILQPDYDKVKPDFPLPKPPREIVPEDYASYFHPREARMRRMQNGEWRKKYEALEPVRERRRQEQRVMDGTEWPSYWSLEDVSQGKSDQVDGASFFPYGDFEGLEALSDVFATISGDQVKLWHAADLTEQPDELGEFENRRDGQRASLVPVASARIELADLSTKEELFALAWSVNLTTWPFTPMLAVGGRGRSIYIFVVDFIEERDEQVTMKLRLDRTIVGHGQAIVDLKFSLSHPHLLVSASEDRTARLLDPTVPLPPLTSSYDTRQPPPQKNKGKGKGKAPEKAPHFPPPGETVAILANEGHTKPLLSIDIHPRFPLILTTSLDGYILIWSLPSSILPLLGPRWPSPGSPLPTAPAFDPRPRPPPPLLPAPIFSSASIHAKWPDQALWACATSCHIISKAGRAPAPEMGVETEGKEVKLWIPLMLDSRWVWTSTPRCYGEQEDGLDRKLSERGATFLDGRDDNPVSGAFQVLRRVDVEDENALGERMGLHLLPTSPTATLDDIAETILLLPLSLTDELYAFRPFAAPPPPPPSSSSTTSQHLSQRALLASRIAPLLPTGKERLLYEWSPRLRPSSVMSLSKGEKAGKESRYRCAAVQPEGAKWVVVAGEGGGVMLWRRRRRGRTADVQMEA